MNQDDIIRSIRQESAPAPSINVSRFVIPQGVEIPRPESILELSGVPVFTKKSISTLIGKAKSGKTTATAWIVASCITGGLRVLWIDTEQGEYYGSRTQFWILRIAGLEKSEHLTYLDLKTLKPEDRTKLIEQAIEEYKPDLLVIDGIRDLVYDINSPEESTIIVGHVMRWAEQYDIHVLNILHQNKGNEHARGHLGAEIVNKSETVIKVDQDEVLNIVCSPEFTRSEPFQEFAFNRDSYGIPQLIEGWSGALNIETGSRKIEPSDYSIEEHRTYLETAFRGSKSLNYGELQSAIIAAFGLYGVRIGVVKSKTFISHYLMLNLLKSEKDGKFTNYYIVD